MKERSLYEWFDLLEISGDEDFIEAFCASLDGYRAVTVSLEDKIQFINLFAALRMHQLKHGGRRSS